MKELEHGAVNAVEMSDKEIIDMLAKIFGVGVNVHVPEN